MQLAVKHIKLWGRDALLAHKWMWVCPGGLRAGIFPCQIIRMVTDNGSRGRAFRSFSNHKAPEEEGRWGAMATKDQFVSLMLAGWESSLREALKSHPCSVWQPAHSLSPANTAFGTVAWGCHVTLVKVKCPPAWLLWIPGKAIKAESGCFLVVQWLRLHAPKAGAQSPSLVRELDPTCCT